MIIFLIWPRQGTSFASEQFIHLVYVGMCAVLYIWYTAFASPASQTSTVN